MAIGKTIRIQASSPPSARQLLLPRQWMKDLGLAAGRCDIAFGAKRVNAYVRELTGRNVGDIALLSGNLLDELHLEDGIEVPLILSGKELRLGDVYGILANVKLQDGQPTGQQERVFRHLLQEAKALGMYGYVFSPLEIDWNDLSAVGYRFSHRQWMKVQVPLPDVLYDQIVSRKFEKREDVAPHRERLCNLLARRYFNPGYFDKWQVHEWLSGHELTDSYVPETIRYKSVEQASTFLYRYADVYVKPVHGSLGIGILRVRRRPDGQVFCQMKHKDGTLRQENFGSISLFLKKYHTRLLRGPYLIQESLQLMTRMGRPFDIRLVMQKDETGTWQRTKTFCRIAQEGEITSNLSTGGDAIAVKELLKEIFGDDKRVNRVMKDLRKIASDVPAVIEQNQGGTVGELGLDLGLDETGRLFVIEVNAKPWKKPNIEEGEWRDLALLAFQRPVRFAQYLCKHYRDG